MPRGKQSLRRIDKELRLAASQKKLVLMEYKADDEEKAKSYLLEPYSYRENGAKFFAFDRAAKSIKAFKTENIIRVSPLGKTFKPRWKVELAA